MKKIIITILLAASILGGSSVFAMTQEEYNQLHEQFLNYYYEGLYYEALAELEKIVTGHQWSEEDLATFNEDKEFLLYALDNLEEVYSGFGRVQSYCDQGLYYEAMNELNLLSQNYKLTWREQQTWNAKMADAKQGIINYNNKVSFDEINKYYKKGLYYEANSVLTSMNTSTMNNEHKELWSQWKEKIGIELTRMENEAKAAKNREKLSSFYVGCSVKQNVLLISQRVGVVREINYNTGKVKVYWSKGYDSNGYEINNYLINAAYLKIGSEEWCDPGSLIIM